jgi:hypothetical protein
MTGFQKQVKFPALLRLVRFIEPNTAFLVEDATGSFKTGELCPCHFVQLVATLYRVNK